MRRALIVLFTASIVVAAPPAHAEGGVIEIAEYAYTPATTAVNINATTGFLADFWNNGTEAHTANANGHMFRTGQIAAGGAHAFETIWGAGTYAFHCANTRR